MNVYNSTNVYPVVPNYDIKTDSIQFPSFHYLSPNKEIVEVKTRFDLSKTQIKVAKPNNFKFIRDPLYSSNQVYSFDPVSTVSFFLPLSTKNTRMFWIYLDSAPTVFPTKIIQTNNMWIGFVDSNTKDVYRLVVVMESIYLNPPSIIADIPLNTWTHCAIVRNDNNYDIYVNGGKVLNNEKGQTNGNSDSLNNIITTADIMYLNYYDYYQHKIGGFKGYMYGTEFYVYNMSKKEVNNRYNLTNINIPPNSIPGKSLFVDTIGTTNTTLDFANGVYYTGKNTPDIPLTLLNGLTSTASIDDINFQKNYANIDKLDNYYNLTINSYSVNNTNKVICKPDPTGSDEFVYCFDGNNCMYFTATIPNVSTRMFWLYPIECKGDVFSSSLYRIYFNANSQLEIEFKNNRNKTKENIVIPVTQSYAWTHYTIVCDSSLRYPNEDSTQPTLPNYCKIYVNGIEIKAKSEVPNEKFKGVAEVGKFTGIVNYTGLYETQGNFKNYNNDYSDTFIGASQDSDGTVKNFFKGYMYGMRFYTLVKEIGDKNTPGIYSAFTFTNINNFTYS